MTTSNWTAAVSGSPSYSGQINQFLGAHASYFSYAGSAIPGAADPTSITAYSSSDRISTAQYLAQPFTITGVSNVTIQTVAPALVRENAGCDVLLMIQPAGGPPPTGFLPSNALAYAVIPAEWLPTTTPANAAAIPPIPLNAPLTLTPSSNYWVVIVPYSNCVPSVNDVWWARSGGGFTGTPYAYNVASSSWATTGSAAFATYFRAGFNGLLTATTEDNDSMKKSYLYTSSRISSVYTWTNAQSNPNLLCRDDAIFSSSVGTWQSSANATVALSSNTLSVTATATTPVVRAGYSSSTNVYAVTAGAQYTFSVQVKAGSTGRSVTPAINWYATSSSTSSLSSVAGTAVTDTTTGWTTISVTGTAPAGANFARVNVTFTGAVTSEVHYLDNAMLNLGPSAVFATPRAGVSTVRTLTYNGSNVLTSVT
jgi:hypothetical protein